MSKTTILVIGLGILQAASAFAAEVWRAVPNTGTEMDVQTEGYPVCAYTANNNDTTVNGVLFTRWMSADTFGGDDITFSPTLSGRYNGYYTLESGTAIATLLGNAAYYGSGDSMTLTFKNLQPGCRYRAQLFFVDTRGETGVKRWAKIEGVTQPYCEATEFPRGGSLVGEFVAAAETKVVSVSYPSEAVQINAVQLRRLDDGWSVSNTTGAASDVDARGSLVAAKAAVGAIVNGVRFEAVQNANFGEHLEIALASGALATDTGNFGGNIPDASVMKPILKGGFYTEHSATATLKVKNLELGHRYLVQIWVCDSRDIGDLRSWRIDDYVTANFRQGAIAPYGCSVSRVFVADGAQREFVIRPVSGSVIQINAIQLRELSTQSSRIDEWVAQPLTGQDADVLTTGDLSCAYLCYAQASSDAVVNGVSFQRATAYGSLGTLIGFSNAFQGGYNGYLGTTGAFSDEYAKLLKHASYGRDNVSTEVTVKGLGPGFRGLIQMFFSDTRAEAGLNRWASIEGKRAYYDSSVDPNFPLGGTLIGNVRADARGEARVTVDFVSQQLNAIQVRKLGFDGYSSKTGGAWSTDGAGWILDGTDCAGQTLWDAVNGPKNSAGVDSMEATLGLTTDVWADTLNSRGSVTVNGEGRRLTLTYGVFAGEAIVNAVWGGERLLKTSSGRLVLAGGYPDLKEAVITAGEVEFASSNAAGVDVKLGEGGTLSVGKGCALKVASLSGPGCVKGPGRVDLVSGGAFSPVSCGIQEDNACWGLFNGSTLEYPAGSDLSKVTVYVDDPVAAAAEKRVVLHVQGPVSGKPEFILPDQRYRAYWDADASGYVVSMRRGLFIVME